MTSKLVTFLGARNHARMIFPSGRIERTMPIKQLSLTEVRVEDLVYTFIDSDETKGFLTCLLTESLTECELRHPPLARRTFRTDPEDFEPGA